ncbi:cell division control protein 45 homolog [Tubulanus polymorphus]|uniref:cell division control protein 45 homolog n=1 Tax=Tubulanus polymorphus TaxID=672921 RepID=UPI003DA48962
MVVIKDFRRDFYETIHGQRILVLVAFDVDALCALKILQYLFQCDQVLYTIVPVAGRQDMDRAFIENGEGIKYVLLLNCGGCMDIVEQLQPPDDVVFFICDSHRPIDVHNIYNVKQVKILAKSHDLQDVPEFDDVFRDESDDDDSGNESEGSEASGKKRRFDEDAIEKRRAKRLWEENREKILYEYTEFTYQGCSAAMTVFEMAWKMSKDTNDLLWIACIGLTDQYIHYKINREKYVDCIGDLQNHVSRLNHRGADEESRISVDCLKVSFEDDMLLNLYRHWTLYDSLCHSAVSACQFKIWTMKGKKRLDEFLADMGLPLSQCRQKYSAMDMSLRNSVKEMIETKSEKYGISTRDIFLPSFVAQYGFKNRLSAMDAAYACAALLESVDKNKADSDKYLNALDLLSRSNRQVLQVGLDFAKMQVKAIVNQVQTFLDMNQIISAGPFLYAFITEGTADIKFFSRPICLQRLAKFTLQAHVAMSRSKKAPQLPLIVGAPMDSEIGMTLICGIPPLAEDDGKNVYGKAFEQAAINTNARILQDSFDTHIVELQTADRSKFFDALIALMQ